MMHCVFCNEENAKANYSSRCIGHYGLGFSNYVHFTSPIRRYSDLMVHRILKGMKIENHDIIAVLKDCNEVNYDLNKLKETTIN